jgi:hypothetical protein
MPHTFFWELISSSFALCSASASSKRRAPRGLKDATIIKDTPARQRASRPSAAYHHQPYPPLAPADNFPAQYSHPQQERAYVPVSIPERTSLQRQFVVLLHDRLLLGDANK